ncbi:nucleotide exchange factor GrpE [Terrisporobacter sp.]
MLDEKNYDKSKLSEKDIDNVNCENLYEIIEQMKNDIKYINKNSKKTIMSINLLKEEIGEKNELNFKLKKSLEEKNFNEVKIYKKIIKILDQIDNIYKFAVKVDSEEFLHNLKIIKKVIGKEIGEIELIEIKSLGEFFNPEIHKCIAMESDDSKEQNEIISVIENGYMLRGKVIRPASVIIAR